MLSKIYNKCFSIIELICERLVCLISHIESSSYCGKVMMYHEIILGDIRRTSCKCSVSHFLSDLDELSSSGFEFVSILDSLRIIKNKERRKFAVITFDDVSDTFFNVYPILRERKIPYTLFVAMKYTKQEGFLSIMQLKELILDPLCTIGGHTLTHPKLRYCQNSFQEILGGKQQLESLLGCEVKYFAYPYGKFRVVSPRNKKEAEQAGYECAFSAIKADVTPTTRSLNYYYMPRLTEVWK